MSPSLPLIPVLPVPLSLSRGLISLAPGTARRAGLGKGGGREQSGGENLKFGSRRWRGGKELNSRLEPAYGDRVVDAPLIGVDAIFLLTFSFKSSVLGIEALIVSPALSGVELSAAGGGSAFPKQFIFGRISLREKETNR